MNVIRRSQLDAVDSEDVVTGVDVCAGCCEWRTQIRIPTLVVVNPRHFVAPVFDCEIRAEQTSDGLRHSRHIAAAHVRVPDRDLSAHDVQQVIEIGAMHHVRQQLPVHLFHLWPIRAVHVWHVEIVALVAPAFVEDLFELFLRFEIHAQGEVQTSRAWLWRRAISIDEKQLRRRSVARTATWTTTLTAATAAAR